MIETQAVDAECESCRSKYRISEEHTGKRVTCKKCGMAFEVKNNNGENPAFVIAKLALKYNLISENQLKDVLKDIGGSGNGSKLEDILLAKGLIDENQKRLLTATKDFLGVRKKDQLESEVLIEKEFINREDLEAALTQQKLQFKKDLSVKTVFDILCESGKINPESISVPPMEQNQAADENSKNLDIKEIHNSFDLFVSEDKIAAYVQLKKPVDDRFGCEAINYLLEKEGVVYGLTDASQISEYLNNHEEQNEPFRVAEGKPPQVGNNGQIKYYFDSGNLRADASDLKANPESVENENVQPVQTGDLLAEKIISEDGESGIDVYGEEIPPPDPRDIKLCCGSGAEISEDGQKVFAATDGQPGLSFDGKIIVLAELEIPGDVDQTTGSIEFDGNIRVEGTIKSGFQIKGRNLIAKEIIGAEVEVSGDVIVSGGIIGTRVKAHGEIRAKYIKSSTIETFGDVIARQEIIDSEIRSSGQCRIEQGKILSSVISARKGVEAMDVGSEISNPTKLMLGHDKLIQNKLEHIEQDISRKQKIIAGFEAKRQALEEDINTTHKEIGRIAQIQDKATAEHRTLEDKLETLKNNGVEQGLDKAESHLKGLSEKLRSSEEAISKLFEEQDIFTEQADTLKDDIKTKQKEIEDLNHELGAIAEWDQKEKRSSTARVTGSIHEGSTIIGMRSNKIIPSTFNNVMLREIKRKGASGQVKWEIEVFAQR